MKKYNQCEKVKNKLSTKILLFYFLKKLSRRKNHLKTYINSAILLKTDQIILYKVP